MAYRPEFAAIQKGAYPGLTSKVVADPPEAGIHAHA
jgi:hypothetical protein